jgi:chromosome segregation ATPase
LSSEEDTEIVIVKKNEVFSGVFRNFCHSDLVTVTPMSENKLYRKPINVARGRQLELSHDSFVGQSALSGDLESKLRDQQSRLAQLETEREEIERQAQALEELNSKKRIFLSSQVEVTEKLTNACTLIDRELLTIRKELHELEQCRHAFDSRLKKIAKFDPESWKKENLLDNLDKAITIIDLATEEYEEAGKHFASMRSGEIFGTSKRRKTATFDAETGEFLSQVKNGLAFNLPIITLALIGLVIYLLK